MLKTRKITSLLLIVAILLSIAVISATSVVADSNYSYQSIADFESSNNLPQNVSVRFNYPSDATVVKATDVSLPGVQAGDHGNIVKLTTSTSYNGLRVIENIPQNAVGFRFDFACSGTPHFQIIALRSIDADGASYRIYPLDDTVAVASDSDWQKHEYYFPANTSVSALKSFLILPAITFSSINITVYFDNIEWILDDNKPTVPTTLKPAPTDAPSIVTDFPCKAGVECVLGGDAQQVPAGTYNKFTGTTGSSIEFTVPNGKAGDYMFRLIAKPDNSRGTYQLYINDTLVGLPIYTSGSNGESIGTMINQYDIGQFSLAADGDVKVKWVCTSAGANGFMPYNFQFLSTTVVPTSSTEPTTAAPTTIAPTTITPTTDVPTTIAPTTPFVPTTTLAPTGPTTVVFGDVNSDQTVNAKDVLLLKQYLAQWSVTISAENTDVNADDVINAKDLLKLRKYLADYPVVLGEKD